MRQKFTLQFSMKGTPISLLWKHIATPSGLSQWFSDDVQQHEKVLTFSWKKGGESVAHITAMRTGIYIRMKWEDDDDPKSFFELRIETSELTSGTTLMITDFADDDSDRASSTELWEHQIDKLKRVIGC